MNEQLQKLYEQSFVTDTYVNVGPDGAKLGIRFDPERFAELIVQDCANFVRETYDHEAAESIAWTMEINYGLHGDYA